MGAVDKLYDRKNNIVTYIDNYTLDELISFKKQIDMQIEERQEQGEYDEDYNNG